MAIYLRMIASPEAANFSDYEGVVLNAARDTVIGEFSGQSFTGHTGYAEMKVAAGDISPNGGDLTVSDTPLAIAYNTTVSTPLVFCTVINE